MQNAPSLVIDIAVHPLSPERCDHAWSLDGEKCLTGCTTEPYPAIDEWEQPVCCEKCGETAFFWVGFELDRLG
ncbi:MAG: hypothetical protein H7X89_04810 [Rhizobiales bacterium]|nr:hypothetical protein [Hyphomicrobiales bacterium]